MKNKLLYRNPSTGVVEFQDEYFQPKKFQRYEQTDEKGRFGFDRRVP